jgi:hypothetical protein
MSGARDLVFFFNGVELTGERVENVPAEFPVPVKGQYDAPRRKSLDGGGSSENRSAFHCREPSLLHLP